MTYFKWEARKLWKKNKILLFLLIGPLIVCTLYTCNYFLAKTELEQMKQSVKEDIAFSGQLKETMEQNIFLERNKQKLERLTAESGEILLKSQKEMIEDMTYFDSAKMIGENQQPISQSVLDLNLAEIDYMKQNNIQPQKPLTLLLPKDYQTNFTHEELDSYNYLNGERRNANGLLFIYNFFKQGYSTYFIALCILLFGSFFCSEKTTKHNHLSLLKLEGISLSKILFTKSAIIFCYVCLFIVALFLPMLLLSIVLSGLGQASYPILYYFTTDLIKEYTWITLAQYIFEAITLMLFVSFFFIELLMLVSFFVKNEIYVWLAGGLFLIIGGKRVIIDRLFFSNTSG